MGDAVNTRLAVEGTKFGATTIVPRGRCGRWHLAERSVRVKSAQARIYGAGAVIADDQGATRWLPTGRRPGALARQGLLRPSRRSVARRKPIRLRTCSRGDHVLVTFRDPDWDPVRTLGKIGGGITADPSRTRSIISTTGGHAVSNRVPGGDAPVGLGPGAFALVGTCDLPKKSVKRSSYAAAGSTHTAAMAITVAPIERVFDNLRMVRGILTSQRFHTAPGSSTLKSQLRSWCGRHHRRRR
jgi:hypothetical protein